MLELCVAFLLILNLYCSDIDLSEAGIDLNEVRNGWFGFGVVADLVVRVSNSSLELLDYRFGVLAERYLTIWVLAFAHLIARVIEPSYS